MMGQLFFCNGCHRIKLIQEAHYAKMLNTIIEKPDPDKMFWPGAAMRELTNGWQVMFQGVLFCTTCIPEGAETVALADLGLRPDDPDDEVSGDPGIWGAAIRT